MLVLIVIAKALRKCSLNLSMTVTMSNTPQILYDGACTLDKSKTKDLLSDCDNCHVKDFPLRNFEVKVYF